MLLMSASEEAELEQKRTRFGGCELAPGKKRLQYTLPQVLAELPNDMSSILRDLLKAGGRPTALSLKPEEVTAIETASKKNRREIMIMLLGVASAMAETLGESSPSSTVVEGATGAMYIGIPVSWMGKGIKFSAHGVQTAVLNAWHQGEPKLRHVVVETQPCTCCRQFLRETWGWEKIKIIHATNSVTALKKGDVTDISLSLTGLKLNGIKSRLMDEPKRTLRMIGTADSELVAQAYKAASFAYAPYFGNFAGAAVQTKAGTIYQGRSMEAGASIVGISAIESALINVVLSNEAISNVTEIVLVETRSTVTQFSSTQKLAQAMGTVPFRYIMAG